MNRRRLLTGAIAAPFVARLGLLMPVTPLPAEVLRPRFVVNIQWLVVPSPIEWAAIASSGFLAVNALAPPGEAA